ncbi:MAG: hypothetical protein HKN47_14060 [Pirellulaceae bacterium]|nr:hypothetical protein [Pirellulaceae bacterium]
MEKVLCMSPSKREAVDPISIVRGLDARSLQWVQFVLGGLICMMLASIYTPTAANAQTQPAALLQAEPAKQGEYQSGTVAPASLTTAARVLNLPTFPSSEKQIRINIRYLLVDDPTRKAIYDQIGHERVNTRTQRLPDSKPPTTFVDEGRDLNSSRVIQSTSCVSTSVLTHEMTKAMLQQVAESQWSKVTAAPSLILVDGQEGQINEGVQRPFVVDVQSNSDVPTPQAERTETQQAASRPHVQVLDEGTAMRVRAVSLDQGRVHVASEIVNKRILEVRSEPVFGTGKASAVMHVPVHQIETAAAAEEFAYGETLLIDPYVSRQTEVQVESGVPLLSKIPYINRSFKNTAAASQTLHWMVLVQPVHP